LQREIVEGEPGTSTYRATIHAFRQLGYVLMSCGFEEDLDRLLRIRIVEGGRSTPVPRTPRADIDLHLVEQRRVP
jgi:hypothetical protein